VPRPFPLVKAMNLVTSTPARDMALAAPGRSGRMLTLVPWRGHAIVGTSQSSRLADPADTGVAGEELAALIADANHAFPSLHLTAAQVTLVHRGVVPAAARPGETPDLKPRPDILDHASEGVDGAITVVGVKYTTARGVAERVAELVSKRAGRRAAASRTARTTLPGAGIADHEALAIGASRTLGVDVSLSAIQHLIGLYAEATPEIIRLMKERADLRMPLAPGVSTLGAEIVYAIRSEMAVRLSDIVMRRTGLGSSGRPPAAALEASARIAAAELGWDAARAAEEIAAVESVYAIG
nr:hypothetical protein [Acidobacteriota bacterium]